MSDFGVDRVIEITLTRQTVLSGDVSFDIPAIIGTGTPNASFGATNRAKLYTVGELSAVADDWGSASDQYAAAESIAQQSPSVNSFYIIKRDATVARVSSLVKSDAFTAGDEITGFVNGITINVPFDTDNDTTLGNLATAIAATDGIASAVASAPDTINITADPDYPIEISLAVSGGSNTVTFTNTVTTEGHAIDNDITLALEEAATAKWYGLYLCNGSDGTILTAAAKIQTEKLIGAAQSNDTDIKGVATDDIASRLLALAYDRFGVFYRETLTDHQPAGAFSRFFARDPGSISMALKNVIGSVPDVLTGSEISILEGKNANNYAQIGSLGRIKNGVVANGSPFEYIRDSDYLAYELQEALFNLLTTRDKTPYTEEGLLLVETTGQGVMDRMVLEGVLSPDYPVVFSVPALADISASDKQNRCLPDCKAVGTYANGIIKIVVEASVVLPA